MEEKCSKCQTINYLEEINPYICCKCGCMNVPKKLASKFYRNKNDFYLKRMNKMLSLRHEN